MILWECMTNLANRKNILRQMTTDFFDLASIFQNGILFSHHFKMQATILYNTKGFEWRRDQIWEKITCYVEHTHITQHPITA